MSQHDPAVAPAEQAVSGRVPVPLTDPGLQPPPGSLARHHSRQELRRRRLGWLVVGILAGAALGAAGALQIFGANGRGADAGPGAQASRLAAGAAGNGVVTRAATAGPDAAPASVAPGVLSAQTLVAMTSSSAVVDPAGGTAFASDDQHGRVVSFDPTTGRVERQAALGAPASAMTLAGGDLWVADTPAHRVVEMDPATLRTLRVVPLPAGPVAMAALGGTLWVTSDDHGEVTPVSLGSGVVGGAIAVPAGAFEVASGFGALWVTGGSDVVTRIVPGPTSLVPPALQTVGVGSGPAGSGPVGIAVGSGSVWVVSAGETVSQVDPASLAVVATLPSGPHPDAIAVGEDGRVYVASATADRVQVVSPSPGTKPLTLATSPQQLVAAGSGVWVLGTGPGQVIAVS